MANSEKGHYFKINKSSFKDNDLDNKYIHKDAILNDEENINTSDDRVNEVITKPEIK